MGKQRPKPIKSSQNKHFYSYALCNSNCFVGIRTLSTNPIQGGKTKLDLPEGVARYMFKFDNVWQCGACNDGVAYTSSSNLRAHIESRHYSPGYSCEICNKTMKTRNGYKNHMKVKHSLS